MTASKLHTALDGLAPHLPVAIALSGGADSTALLLAAWQRWPTQVAAIHVNHGLQSAASTFEQFCQALCAQRHIPLHIARVNAGHSRGQSPEDAARRVRYQALTQGAAALADTHGLCIASIALAQHADDQVETLLLALSRGAGLPGLAAMPAQWHRGGLTWLRPFLGIAGQDLRQWLTAQHQTWVEDPTNTDPRFTRNRIRHTILPALEAAFPAFRQTFARSSSHAQQAQEILQEVAEQDLLRIGEPPLIETLQQLTQARQANALRLWLRKNHGVAAQQRQMQELLKQVAACTTRGHQIRLKLANGYVELEKGHLQWVE